MLMVEGTGRIRERRRNIEEADEQQQGKPGRSLGHDLLLSAESLAIQPA